MLLKPVAEIPVSIEGYTWDSESLVPRCEDGPTYEDGTPVAQSQGDRELQGLDRTYDPFEDAPGLFLMFARLESTPEAIMEFATEYGNLDRSSMNSWRRVILRIRSAVDLWEAIKQEDQDLLSQHVRWVGPRLEIINPLARRFIHSGEFFDIPQVMPPMSEPSPMGEYRFGDLLKPAQDVLEWILKLGRFPGGNITPVQPSPGRFRFELHVTNLHHVLWLQWLMAVCENQTFHNCEHCRRPILLVPNETRSDRRYCSNACQMRAYRKRVSTAKHMRKEGRHLREIAKAVGSDMATVKKWVAEA